MQVFGVDLNAKTLAPAVVAVALVVVYLAWKRFEGFTDGNHQKLLVLYYAPWCGHCKRLMPEWEKVEKAHQGDAKVKVTKVNCDKEPEKAKKEGVQAFPTIILYKNGEKQVYQESRTAQAIEAFLSKA